MLLMLNNIFGTTLCSVHRPSRGPDAVCVVSLGGADAGSLLSGVAWQPPFSGFTSPFAAKFYLFDVGVWNYPRGASSLDPGSSEYGKAFEHWIAMELRAWVSYSRSRLPLRFWRTCTGLEVDFILEHRLAIEAKSATRVSDKHLRGLRAFCDEEPRSELLLVSLDENDRTTEDGIRLLHWRRFAELLWSGELVPEG
ncbi:MAG: DUF4143 domain-containing protein [Spirochaetaceae bacterium]|nr:MAG: DUF4143 domain-containing protein [Spirochaetaceae bacterium]